MLQRPGDLTFCLDERWHDRTCFMSELAIEFLRAEAAARIELPGMTPYTP
jgi:hypothetical protein